MSFSVCLQPTECFLPSPIKDLELNRDFNGEDYEYEDEAKLVIFPDHFEIPLPNIEELPALVSGAARTLCVFLCMLIGNVHSVVLQPESTVWEFVKVLQQESIPRKL